MANNVYIGDRYVPLFDGDWVNNKTYEALTIVTYGNNTYTSKRPVPLNTPPVSGGNNDPYWALTGNYNGQITYLQNQINNITALMNKLINRKFLFIGDSYAAAHSNTWVEYACSYIGVSNFENVAVSGTGFNGSGGVNGFKQQLVDYTGDKTTITDIVVGGGLNDSNFNGPGTTRTDLITHMQDFVNYAKSNYPNASLWLCYMGNAFDNSAALSGRTLDKRRWAKSTYETEGAKQGFKIIPFGDDYLGSSDLFMASDGVHPSNYGSQVLGICIGDGLLNASHAPTRGYYPINLAAVGNNEIYLNPSLRYDCCNGYVDFSSTGTMQINIGTDHPTITSHVWYDLFTFDGLYFNHPAVLPLYGILSSTDEGAYCAVPIMLKFEGNKCSFKFYQTNGHGAHVSHTIPAYGGVMVERFNTMIPSWYVA